MIRRIIKYKEYGTISKSKIILALAGALLLSANSAQSLESIESDYKYLCPSRKHSNQGKNCRERKHMDYLHWSSAPKSKDSGLIVVCVHALGLSGKAYASFAEHLANRGIETYAIDVRGFGRNRDNPSRKRVDFESGVKDLEQFINHLRAQKPGKSIVLVGESMGGAMTMRLAGRNPDLVDGIICSAPAWQLFELRKIAAKGILDLFLGEPGMAADSVMKQATSDKELHQYWLEGGETKLRLSVGEAFAYLKFMKTMPENASKIDNIPVMIIQGLHDRLSKPSASAELFGLLKSPNKELCIAADSEHLVLEENQLNECVLDEIDNWLQTHVISEAVEPKQNSEPVKVISKYPISEKDKLEIEQLIELSGEHVVLTSATLSKPY